MSFSARLQQSRIDAGIERAGAAERIAEHPISNLFSITSRGDVYKRDESDPESVFYWIYFIHKVEAEAPEGVDTSIWIRKLASAIVQIASMINLITSMISQLQEFRRPAPPPILHSTGRPILASISVRLSTVPLTLV